jgi:hypothetical protein
MHALTKGWERQRSRKQSRGRVGFGANRALPVAARCRQDGRSLSFPRHTSAPYGCSQGAAETTVIGLGAAFKKGREFTKEEGYGSPKGHYRTSKEAADKLPSTIVSFYQTSYPDVYAARSQDSQTSQVILVMQPQRLSGFKGHMGKVSKYPRAYGFSRLL